MQIPRPEHPNPQFYRSAWMNLNGIWKFEIDNGRSGVDRGMNFPEYKMNSEILVPFCPESKLSGVEHRDFMYGVWYQKTVSLTEEQCAGRVVLHFGAVDYQCDAYINGVHADTHKGGYASFSFDITKLVHAGDNCVTVYAQDDTRDPMVPKGKQSGKYHSYGCLYTRTTGIWQTVWLEFTPKSYILSADYETDIASNVLVIKANVRGTGHFRAEAFFNGQLVGQAQTEAVDEVITLTLPLQEKHLWDIGQGNLYDLKLTYGDDVVQSYFAMRSIKLHDGCFYLNGRPVFQRLVLDQGFYPDGIYTAPTEEELVRDIDLGLAMGFNGARLHEKVFEQRYLYHCDRKGYMVWGEYPDWGLNHCDPMAIYGILPEWSEILQRDRNHPAIITWCIFNETEGYERLGRTQSRDLLRTMYRTTKMMDPQRPCIDASGYLHVETDIFDIHDYDQNPVHLRAFYDALNEEGTCFDGYAQESPLHGRQEYHGEPIAVSEYGGIQWSEDAASWGYGEAPATKEEFLERLKGLTDALLDNPKIMGFCYTQLTDVEQEQNGLHTYERVPKFPAETICNMISRSAAIEQR